MACDDSITSITIAQFVDDMNYTRVFANSQVPYATTPQGTTQPTIYGIIQQGQDAIDTIGYNYLDPATFETGATLTTSADALRWATADGGNGQYYRWAGVLPKVVPAGSTPAATGGVGESAWRAVGNGESQQDLATLVDLATAPFVAGRIYTVVGFYDGWAALAEKPKGGGQFVAVSGYDRTKNDGGTVASVAALTAWRDAAVTAGGVTTTNLKNNLGLLLAAGSGTGDTFVRLGVEDTAKLSWYGWNLGDDTQDGLPLLNAAARNYNHVQINDRKAVYLGGTFEYPRNAFTLSGLYGAPYSSNSQIRPISTAGIGDFTDNALIDMNESGSDAAQGGSFNTLKDLLIFGGMSDFKDSGDPLAGLIGVRGINTFFRCQMERVAFRNCGIPFDIEGFMHVIRDCSVYQCYEGFKLDSTLSSTIDTMQLATCAKNWGTLSNCKVQNSTIQQGNELPTLDDNIGMRINGTVVFDNVFTEGGNAHYWCEDGAKLHLVNGCTLGYTQLEPSGYGSYNIKANTDCEIYIDESCRIGGPRSFLIDTPENAKVIKVQFEYDGRFSNTADAAELPNYLPSTLYVRRSYGTLDRVDYVNTFTYSRVELGTGSAVIFDQLTTSGLTPFGGDIYIQAGGSSTYDKYHVEFSDSSDTAENVTINTIFRNTGGSGTANVDLTYSGGQLVAQGKLSNHRLIVKVVSTGAMYLKEITVTP